MTWTCKWKTACPPAFPLLMPIVIPSALVALVIASATFCVAGSRCCSVSVSAVCKSWVCFFGIIRACPGLMGPMVKNAKVCVSS